MVSVTVLTALSRAASQPAPAAPPLPAAANAGARDVVGRAGVGRAPAHSSRQRAGSAATDRHIAGGEADDRLAEDHREVDRGGVGGVELATCLVDGERGARDIVGD